MNIAAAGQFTHGLRAFFLAIADPRLVHHLVDLSSPRPS